MDADHIAAAALIIVALLMLLPGLIVRLGATESDRPRRESMSERHDRLDREALARTRPTSSNRKAGRTGVTR